MSLRRQNDIATGFWRHNDVIFALCVHWELGISCLYHGNIYTRRTISLYWTRPLSPSDSFGSLFLDVMGCVWYRLCRQRQINHSRSPEQVTTCLKLHGTRFKIKMSLTVIGLPTVKRTVIRSSYFHNVNSFPGKMWSVYWIDPWFVFRPTWTIQPTGSCLQRPVHHHGHASSIAGRYWLW